MEALVAVVTRMFVKYWIYVCGTMFFFVSFEGKIVLYKVIYMVMFLCCVALYQVILQAFLLQVQLPQCRLGTTARTACSTTSTCVVPLELQSSGLVSSQAETFKPHRLILLLSF